MKQDSSDIFLFYEGRKVAAGDKVAMAPRGSLVVEISSAQDHRDETLQVEVLKELTPVIPVQDVMTGLSKLSFRFGVHIDAPGLYAVRLLRKGAVVKIVTFEMTA